MVAPSYIVRGLTTENKDQNTTNIKMEMVNIRDPKSKFAIEFDYDDTEMGG